MDGPGTRYRKRLVERPLRQLLAELPAVLINGPRATGKTTTARRFAAEEVRLDQPAQAAAFRADPDAALRDRAAPLLLDEWQSVPEVLGAVKRSVDDDSRPGRFILTGSVRAQLQHELWPGTGRLARVSMFGLTELELATNFDPDAPTFLERAARAGDEMLLGSSPRCDLRAYVELALASGFPEVRTRELSREARHAFLAGYLEQLLSRDAISISPRADEQRLRSYFEVLASSTAGMAADKTLYDAARITAKTAKRYDRLCEELFVADALPAWANNRLQRVEQRAKRYVVDPALAATAALVDAAAVIADGDMLGRILDTFVVAQLRAQVAATLAPVRLHHLRTEHGRREVDVVVELTGGRVLGFEIKATAAPTVDDARHLRWMREELGERFLAGVVFHTGPDRFSLGDGIVALPISSLWAR